MRTRVEDRASMAMEADAEARHYMRTYRADDDRDQQAWRRVVRTRLERMPLSDPDEAGRRKRCPRVEDIYTPYGWNAITETAAAYAAGEDVWLEAWA